MEDAIRLFLTLLHIYYLASVEQQNRNPRLISNYSEAPDTITPVVNAFSSKTSTHKAMQFVPFLVRLLQRVW